MSFFFHLLQTAQYMLRDYTDSADSLSSDTESGEGVTGPIHGRSTKPDATIVPTTEMELLANVAGEECGTVIQKDTSSSLKGADTIDSQNNTNLSSKKGAQL